jgi:hypothetical protein
MDTDELRNLHARMSRMESVVDTLRQITGGAGGHAISQFTVLQMLTRHDSKATATSATVIDFTLGKAKYHAELQGGQVVMHSDANAARVGFDNLRALDKWLTAQKGATPLSSEHLLQYTHAVLAQQGAPPAQRRSRATRFE